MTLAFTVIIVALIAFCALREVIGARERRSLYQRIQAPEIAVVEEAKAKRKPAPPPAMTDEAYEELEISRMNDSG